MRRENSPRTILVVDDDRKTVELIHLYLANEGYQVLHAYDGQTALRLAGKEKPDLIVLDLMLPQIDGLDICDRLCQETDIPIIMVTARATEEDKLVGLETGADDYITKPFSPRELVARIKAVLRRTQLHKEEPLPDQRIGKLVIHYARHEVSRGGRTINLTPREFRLLVTLASQPGRAFSRQELLRLAFGMDFDGLDRTVDVHMMNLRRKIEPDPSNPYYLRTVYGIGYKLVDGSNGA
jgi:DNA-binding response OmpR family regulator